MSGVGERARPGPAVARDEAPAPRLASVDDLWAQLHACTLQATDEMQRRLRTRFGVSAARYDLMAQLHRRPAGMPMTSLARRLMVTGSSVTGLADELEREGLVSREASPSDHRVRIVRLTVQGRRAFDTMAREHRRWMLELFSGLDADAIDRLHDGLVALRTRLGRSIDADTEEPSWDPATAAAAPPGSPAATVPRRTVGLRGSDGWSRGLPRP